MNTGKSLTTSEEDTLITEVIVNHIRASVAVGMMRKHTELFKQLPRMTTISTALIGLFHIFFIITETNHDFKDFFINNTNLIVGMINGHDSFWLELKGWYIMTDGLSKLEIGRVDTLSYKFIESTSALVIYDTFFREDSVVPLFKDFKA